MSSLTASCPTCGRTLDASVGLLCPQCAPLAAPLPPAPRRPPWGVGAAVLIWVASVGLSLILPSIALLGYVILFDRQALTASASGQLSPTLALIFLAAAFVAHVLTLALSWLVVTGGGQRPFGATLNWDWPARFWWPQAAGLAIAMLLLGLLLEQFLPHGETDLEKLLRISGSVRVAVALLAVLSAPLVEEVVYRGVLYTALERARGRMFSVVAVTLLFGAVHVPQYWASPAVIAAVLCLSLALTLLRARTQRLLPCVATHLIFNAIQALVILFQPVKAPAVDPTQAMLLAVISLGGGQ
jgi:membrane protease YdiL (CAAX protease family)